MRILYVWDGKRELPPERKACVASTLSLYPDAEFSCITKASSFYSPAFRVIPWDTVAGQMAAFLKVPKDAYSWTDPMCFSDWARFWTLSQQDNTLYLDTDCRMKARFDFERHGRHIAAGIFLIYVPKGFSGIDYMRLLRERAEKRINYLDDFKGKIGAEQLPAHWYEHRGGQ